MADLALTSAPVRVLANADESSPLSRRTSTPRVTLCADLPRSPALNSIAPGKAVPEEATTRPQMPEPVAALPTSIVDPVGTEMPPLLFPNRSYHPEDPTDTTGGLLPPNTVPTCRTLAVLLRLRVIQIVLGIITVVLGTSACLDQQARNMLCFGVPAGCLTVLAACGRVGGARHVGPGFEHLRISCAGRGVLCLALVSVVANGFLVALSLFVAGRSTSTANVRTLGVVLSSSALSMLIVEATAAFVRWHWTRGKVADR